MKNTLLLIILSVLLISCSNQSDNSMNETPTTKVSAEKLRHVVMFKFKESATPADIQKVEDAFLALSTKIKEVKDLEWGLNNSPEDLNKGFTHCFLVTFENEAGRAVYLPHPDHKAFVEILSPHLEDVLVLDYWAK